MIGLGEDTVNSAISSIANPRSLLTNAATFLVGLGGEAASASVDGSGKMEVIDGYNRARDLLREHRQAAMDYLTSELNKIEERWAAERPDLFQPLPPKNSIDIDGPLFDYEHFASINNSPPGIDSRVDTELGTRRRRNAVDDVAGPITNALDPREPK
ncbi:MAG: hypothetical protein ACRDQF_03945 [Thermocrispum sp.]